MQQGFVRRLIPAIAMLAIAICVAACGGGSGHPSSVKLTIGPSGSAGQPVSAAGIGFYDGKYNSAGIEKAASWLGSPGTVKYAEDFIDATDWAHISDPWQLGDWKGTPYTMVWGVPMLPCGGPSTQCKTNIADYDLLAQGGADGYYKTLAQHLVSAGFGSSYIRIGWEFNGSWYPWGVRTNDDARAFAAYFRRVVTTMRAVAPGLRFDWNPSVGVWPTFDLADAYPGDAYVDDIGLDVYDQSWIADYRDPQARWADLVGQTYGLAWQRDFARAHGKPVSFPEWGVTLRPDGHGGGDDPYYVEQMASWIAASRTAYAVYFDYDASDGAHALADGQFARSATTFRRLFAG